MYSELPNKQTHPYKRAGMESFVIYCTTNFKLLQGGFLSSPIACAACEQMELLKTEIDGPPPPPPPKLF